MDIPLLRYVDIAIGLAVVILLACTVVAAITEALMSGTYFRSRNLRDALSDLIAQVDPITLRDHSYYISERLYGIRLWRATTPFSASLRREFARGFGRCG